MRRILIVLATAWFGLAPIRADGQSSEEAFDQFLGSVEAARDVILARTPEDGPERAEGLRHIIRLIEMQNAPAMDDHDAAHPHVSRCPSIVCKLGFDNPDFTYINVAPISPEYTYRVSGRRGTVPYISMQVFDNPFGGEVFMTSEELVVDEDGRYELILSATRPEGVANWMELKPGAARFIMRNGFYDWDNEVEASVRVEVIEGPVSSDSVPHLSVDEFVSDVSALSLRLSSIPTVMQDARDTWPLNGLNGPNPEVFGIEGAGVPSAVSSAGRYELENGEAMIIETPMPDVVHGGIQIGNLWIESIDYQTRQTSLNWFQSYADDDGIIRYVLAAEDPGVPNWLDISGHPRGGIFMRWQSPDVDAMPDLPTVSVVRMAEIRDRLPANHPAVSRDERTAILAARYIAVNKRRNPTAQFDEVVGVGASTGGGCSAGGSPPGGWWGVLALLLLWLGSPRGRRA
ncbi:MAG: MYXO-CTERM sorting domain-containing protein [Myxococcota bacterium]